MGEPQSERDGPSIAVSGYLTPWRAEVRASFALAWPLVLTQLGAIAIQTTDVVMMGWLGPEVLAAGTLSMSLYMPLWLFSLGLVTAVAPIAAQAVGARQHRAVRHIVRQGFWVALAVGLPASLILWEVRPILLALGQQDASAVLAQDYMRFMLWSFGPSLWLIVLRCFLSALSRPRAMLVTVFCGIILNALGNYALMFGNFGFPALGIVGAGLTSSLVNVIMLLGLLLYMRWEQNFRHYALLTRFWRFDWSRFREILRVGIPIGLGVVAEAMLFSAAALLMGLIGTNTLAAHAIAIQCAAVAFMVPLGVSMAATVRVGLAVGAVDDAGVGRAGWVALGLGLAATTLTASLFLLLPEALVNLFLAADRSPNDEVAALAVSLLAVAALFQLFDGGQVVAMGVLRGLTDTRVPMVIAVIGYWGVGFPASVVLGFSLDLRGLGIWLGLALGLALVAVLLIRRFAYRARLIAPSVPLATESL